MQGRKDAARQVRILPEPFDNHTLGEYNLIDLDIVERDELLELFFVRDWCGGIRCFERLPLVALDILVKRGWADPSDTQNNSPSLGEMLEFMRKFPEVTAHGYAVEAKRFDCRVTVEGLEYDGEPSEEMKAEFTRVFRKADNFICNNKKLYCWYD